MIRANLEKMTNFQYPVASVTKSYARKVNHQAYGGSQDVMAYKPNYYLKRVEYYRSQSRLYYYEHRLAAIARVKAYAARHKAKIQKYKSEWAKKYYLLHPEKVIEKREKRKGRENRFLKLEQLHKYRAKKVINGGQHTKESWEHLLQRFNHTCLACGTTKRIEKDHIVPVSGGGSNDITNLQPLCRSCNASKSDTQTNFIPTWLHHEDLLVTDARYYDLAHSSR